MLSVSIKPHIVVGVVTVWDKPLKHVVDVLICDDWQCGVQASTKLSRIIPIEHSVVRVETILLIVHWIALGEGRYDIYDLKQNEHTSCKTSTNAYIVNTEHILHSAPCHYNSNRLWLLSGYHGLFSLYLHPSVGRHYPGLSARISSVLIHRQSELPCRPTATGYHYQQDSWAISKKTARCAQYMRSFESPHYAPGYFSRNL